MRATEFVVGYFKKDLGFLGFVFLIFGGFMRLLGDGLGVFLVLF